MEKERGNRLEKEIKKDSEKHDQMMRRIETLKIELSLDPHGAENASLREEIVEVKARLNQDTGTLSKRIASLKSELSEAELSAKLQVYEIEELKKGGGGGPCKKCEIRDAIDERDALRGSSRQAERPRTDSRERLTLILNLIG